MTESSERYAKLAGQVADRIATVPADSWDAPTPCEGWTARDLLDHLCDGPSNFMGMVLAPPHGPPHQVRALGSRQGPAPSQVRDRSVSALGESRTPNLLIRRENRSHSCDAVSYCIRPLSRYFADSTDEATSGNTTMYQTN